MRRRQIIVWTLVAAPWVVAVVWGWWTARDVGGLHPAPGAIITVYPRRLVDDAVLALFFYPSLVVLALLVVKAVRAHLRPLIFVLSLALSVLAAVVVLALLLLPAGLAVLALHPWRDLTSLRLSDGRAYHVIEFGEVNVLVEEVRRSPLALRSKVIGLSDNEATFAPLVRPAGVPDYQTSDREHRARLVASRDGRLVVFLHGPDQSRPGCVMNLAFDTKAGHFYQGVYAGQTDTVYDLSPFVLVGARDALKPDDVRALLGSGVGIGAAARDSSHPNPRVREVAARQLAEWSRDTVDRQHLGNPVAPTELATANQTLQRLTSDPDPTVRQAAAEALKQVESLVGNVEP